MRREIKKHQRLTPELVRAFHALTRLGDLSEEEFGWKLFSVCLGGERDELQDTLSRGAIANFLGSIIVEARYKRTFFVIRTRYIALAPLPLQEGDIICILFDCKAPLLIKKMTIIFWLVSASFGD